MFDSGSPVSGSSDSQDPTPVWLHKLAAWKEDNDHIGIEALIVTFGLEPMLDALVTYCDAVPEAVDRTRDIYRKTMLRDDEDAVEFIKPLRNHGVDYFVGIVADCALQIASHINPDEPNHKRVADVIIGIKEKAWTGGWDEKNPQLGWATSNLNVLGRGIWHPSDDADMYGPRGSIHYNASIKFCTVLIRKHAFMARLLGGGVLPAHFRGAENALRCVEESLEPAPIPVGCQSLELRHVTAARAVIASLYILLAPAYVKGQSKMKAKWYQAKWQRWTYALDRHADTIGEFTEGDFTFIPQWDIPGNTENAQRVVEGWLARDATERDFAGPAPPARGDRATSA